MTTATEAKLAREAELPYAAVAMVTDYDCWHEEHGQVDVASVLRIVRLNAERVEALLTRTLKEFPVEHEPCPIGSDSALDGAIMTHPEARDPELMKKLEAIVARAFAKG
jgi:5'-methylthioadenosine phosphorylase